MQASEAAKEIKQRLSIDQLIGRYVTLSKRGANFFGLCPFHQEHTPSFTVRPDLGFFKCFGCGAQGDIFSFLEKHLSLPFLEAVGMLAQEMHISVQGFKAKSDAHLRSEQLLRAVANYFFQLALSSEEAQNYLQKRKIPLEISRMWGIGFGGSIGQLINFLRQQGFTSREAQDAGVLGVDGSRFFCIFNNRLVFPICNTQNKVVGFSGRLLVGDGPKYINSKHSEVFDKGSLFFGLRQAVELKATRLVIVEGFFDVIALHRLNIAAVACCGTNLSEKHAKLLKRYTNELVLCFDNDSAGINASYTALKTLLKHDFLVKSVNLRAKDPDEMFSNNQEEELTSLVINAQDSLQKIIDAIANASYTSLGDKIKAAQNLYPLLSAIANSLTQSQYVRYTAKKLAIEESMLWQEINKNVPEKAAIKTAPAPVTTPKYPPILSDEEKLVLKVLSIYPELILQCENSIFERFHPVLSRYLLSVRSNYLPDDDAHSQSALFLDIPDLLIEHIITGKREARFLKKEEAFAIIADSNKLFEIIFLKNAAQKSKDEIMRAEKANDMPSVELALAEYNITIRKLREAKQKSLLNYAVKTDA